jgi:hypothetical protein
VVGQRLRHLALAVRAHQERHGEDHLRSLAVGGLDRAAHQQVELLVGSPQLDVRPDGDGVVTLQDGVQQLEQRHRLARAPAPGEVLALEDLRDGDVPHQGEERLGGHVEPLGVVADLEPLVRAQNLRGLIDVGAGVGVDLLAREQGPCRGATARIPDARGVVADDEHDGMPGVLELAELLQDDRVTQVHVGRRRVQSELHPQAPSLRETFGEGAGGQAVDGVAGEERRGLSAAGRGGGHRVQC